MRHWSDERTAADAPWHLSHAAADAWADGYNAAVQTCTDEMNSTPAQERTSDDSV